MSVHVESVLEGYSRAMYSTWFFYHPDRLLLDAGEGVASTLGNRTFALQRVLLSHGHIDHISGIPALVYARNAGMGDREKRLVIYYPVGDIYVETLKGYIAQTHSRLTFELEWVPIDEGFRLSLSAGKRHRAFSAFPTDHSRGRLTLGYNVSETRTRLRSEFARFPEDEIKRLVKERGREAVTETFEQKLLSYTGDCASLEPEAVADTELLLHEATIVKEEDMKWPVHSTVAKAVQVAAEARAKALMVYHVSSRYRAADITRTLRKAAREVRLECPVWLWHLESVRRVQ